MSQLRLPKLGRWALVGTMMLAMPLVCGGASGKDPTLHMGINYWPPYTYPSGHEREPGLVQVVLSNCVEEAGYRLEFRDATIPEIFDGLQEGQLDVHVLSYKPSRTEYLAYGSQPLFQAAYRPFVVAGREIEIEDLSDLDGYSIGHKKNVRYSETFEAYLASRRQQGTLAEMESEVQIVDQLVAGEIDVAIMMLSSGLRRAAAQGALDRVRVLDFDVKTSDYFFAVSSRSERVENPTRLLSTVDACIVRLEESGEMERIADRFATVGVEE